MSLREPLPLIETASSVTTVYWRLETASRQHLQQHGKPVLQVPAVDNKVKKAVVQHELCALKAFGEIFADGLADHAWAGKPDQGARFGNIEVAEHRKRRCNTAGSRIGEERGVGNARFVQQRKLG